MSKKSMIDKGEKARIYAERLTDGSEVYTVEISVPTSSIVIEFHAADYDNAIDLFEELEKTAGFNFGPKAGS